MNTLLFVVIILCMTSFAYVMGQNRSLHGALSLGGVHRLNSLPFYHGVLTALWCALPSLTVLVLWKFFDGDIVRAIVLQELPVEISSLPKDELGLVMNQIENIAHGGFPGKTPWYLLDAADRFRQLQVISWWAMVAFISSLMAIIMVISWARIHHEFEARRKVENSFKLALLACSLVAIFTTVGIVLSVLFESLRFFREVPLFEFLFGLQWSPQIAMREGQVAASGSFGAVPLFTGTLLVAAIAMFVAVPAGLMSAFYLSEYASRKTRNIVKPVLEILAGIPTVVYGFFAALTVAPFIKSLGESLGLTVASESALAAGLVMGIMIIPFISSLADDVINAVPISLKEGALGLGATPSETIKTVIIPAALPGIVGGVLLAVSRAIGETMIVVMAAGLSANLTANPLEAVTTITVQIVTLLVGDQEFDSPKTLAAFALGLMLFISTLMLNIYALRVVKKHRERYE